MPTNDNASNHFSQQQQNNNTNNKTMSVNWSSSLNREDKTQVNGLVFLVAYNTMMTSGKSLGDSSQEEYLVSLMYGTNGTYTALLIVLIKQSSQH
jgi:hypothetical protein